MRESVARLVVLAVGLSSLLTQAEAPKPAAPKPALSPSKGPAAAKPAGAARGGYTGLGTETVTPEIIAKYAPPALPPALTRSIQMMLDVRSPSAGQVSPDGKHLYFTWTVTGTPQIWRLDGPKQFPIQLTGGEDTTTLAEVSPDGRYLLISRDRQGEENPGLYWMNATGGPLHEIQHKAKVQTMFEFVSNDGKYVYFRANDIKPDSYAIYRWNKETQQRETVFDKDGLWNVSDHQADGRLLLTKSLGNTIQEIYEWNPQTQVLTPIIGQGEKEEYEAAYGANAGEILILTPKLSEFRRLYRWNKGSLTAVTPELSFDVNNFHIDDARLRILYNVNERGYTRLHAIDAKTFKPLTLPKFPSADHINVSGSTPDGRLVTLFVSLPKEPGQGYVLDWKTNRVTQWQLPSAPEVDTSRFAIAQLEDYPARDGTKIPMWVRRPERCPEPCPVIVEFHGGPEGQSTPGFSPYAQIFVDAGFVFVSPNVRGSDGYGKTWFHADDGAKRLNVITDIEDAAKFVRTKFAKDGQAPKVGIFGGSYGGYSVLVGMTMFAGAYDAGVSIVGISNLMTFLNNTAPYRRSLRTSEYGDPAVDKDALVKLSPLTYLDRIKAPLLVIQGVNDPRVPVGEALQIHDALEARKVASQLILFPDEGHGVRKRSNRAINVGASLRFFEEHLKAKSPDSKTSAAGAK